MVWRLCATLAATILSLPSAAQAKGYRVLHTFAGGTDGSLPFAAPIADSAGNLYGTTEFGGANGSGVVFKLAPDGTETILHAFGANKDGANVDAGLLLDKKGNLYGTTYAGGAHGAGTVFELAADGTETVLYSFRGKTDGGNPTAGLIRDAQGNFYGTTDFGGDDACSPGFGCGVAFRLSANGRETVLHAFAGGADGNLPSGGLLADSAGNLYGVTAAGGAGSCPPLTAGCGTVYRLAKDGAETILYSFAGNSDGAGPYGSPVADSAGNLYGTTYAGGAHDVGTVFEVTPDGKKTTLYTFTNGADGGYPASGLVIDANGNLYGTTCQCADQDQFGNVFEVTPDGTESTLHAFKSGHDGAYPEAGLLLAKDELYGETFIGGDDNDGIVFALKR
jgi:uncharacterized repeat protein (TIGR03803 family)